MGSLAHIVRVLAHRDFRYLWLAQSFSVVGDFVALVALSLYVIQRTGHATDLYDPETISATTGSLFAHAHRLNSFMLVFDK